MIIKFFVDLAQNADKNGRYIIANKVSSLIARYGRIVEADNDKMRLFEVNDESEIPDNNNEDLSKPYVAHLRKDLPLNERGIGRYLDFIGQGPELLDYYKQHEPPVVYNEDEEDPIDLVKDIEEKFLTPGGGNRPGTIPYGLLAIDVPRRPSLFAKAPKQYLSHYFVDPETEQLNYANADFKLRNLMGGSWDPEEAKRLRGALEGTYFSATPNPETGYGKDPHRIVHIDYAADRALKQARIYYNQLKKEKDDEMLQYPPPPGADIKPLKPKKKPIYRGVPIRAYGPEELKYLSENSWILDDKINELLQQFPNVKREFIEDIALVKALDEGWKTPEGEKMQPRKTYYIPDWYELGVHKRERDSAGKPKPNLYIDTKQIRNK